jgi:hypothetical protein
MSSLRKDIEIFIQQTRSRIRVKRDQVRALQAEIEEAEAVISNLEKLLRAKRDDE